MFQYIFNMNVQSRLFQYKSQFHNVFIVSPGKQVLQTTYKLSRAHIVNCELYWWHDKSTFPGTLSVT
jgi:hypothetical protein